VFRVLHASMHCVCRADLIYFRSGTWRMSVQTCASPTQYRFQAGFRAARVRCGMNGCKTCGRAILFRRILASVQHGWRKDANRPLMASEKERIGVNRSFRHRLRWPPVCYPRSESKRCFLSQNPGTWDADTGRCGKPVCDAARVPVQVETMLSTRPDSRSSARPWTFTSQRGRTTCRLFAPQQRACPAHRPSRFRQSRSITNTSCPPQPLDFGTPGS
jgi:hypothetical protein